MGNWYFRLGLKLCSLVVFMIILGFLLLLAVYGLPTAPMEKNLAESAEVFLWEGSYPVTDILGTDSRLDNYTDALMLLTAAYPGDESLTDRALKAYRYTTAANEDPTLVITAHYIDGKEVEPVSYERYWHGYLIMLKPLLLLFDYSEIRLVNLAYTALSLFCLMLLMYRVGLGRYIPALALCLLAVDISAIVRSLQYSSMLHLSVLASMLLMSMYERLRKNRAELLLFFAGIGCAASFLDLLTWPLASFGIPACLMICKDRRKGRDTLLLLICCLGTWLMGYGAMWAGKWLLLTAFGDAEAIKSALTIAFFRSSMADEAGYAFGYLDVLKLNLGHIVSPAGAAALAYILLVMLLGLKSPGAGRNRTPGRWPGLLLLAALPLLWYKLMGNHSYVHHWFTYREMAVSVFALLCMATPPYLVKKKRDGGV